MQVEIHHIVPVLGMRLWQPTRVTKRTVQEEIAQHVFNGAAKEFACAVEVTLCFL